MKVKWKFFHSIDSDNFINYKSLHKCPLPLKDLNHTFDDIKRNSSGIK